MAQETYNGWTITTYKKQTNGCWEYTCDKGSHTFGSSASGNYPSEEAASNAAKAAINHN